MNILIYGKKASGKTLIANLLKQHYEGQGQRVELLEDGVDNPLWGHFLRGPKATAKFLGKTLHNADRHVVVTTQIFPAEMIRPDRANEALFDYVYCTEKL